MTTTELISHLNKLPKDCLVICNTGWEFESEINGVWYSKDRNECHLTQGGQYEKERGYEDGFEMIFCDCKEIQDSKPEKIPVEKNEIISCLNCEHTATLYLDTGEILYTCTCDEVLPYMLDEDYCKYFKPKE